MSSIYTLILSLHALRRNNNSDSLSIALTRHTLSPPICSYSCFQLSTLHISVPFRSISFFHKSIQLFIQTHERTNERTNTRMEEAFAFVARERRGGWGWGWGGNILRAVECEGPRRPSMIRTVFSFPSFFFWQSNSISEHKRRESNRHHLVIQIKFEVKKNWSDFFLAVVPCYHVWTFEADQSRTDTFYWLKTLFNILLFQLSVFLEEITTRSGNLYK